MNLGDGAVQGQGLDSMTLEGPFQFSLFCVFVISDDLAVSMPVYF